jgi:hypothetical protein
MRKLIAPTIAFFTLVQFGPSAVFGHERCTPLKSGWSVFGSRHGDHATSSVAALDRMRRQELALKRRAEVVAYTDRTMAMFGWTDPKMPARGNFRKIA